MNIDINPPTPAPLLRLGDPDRARLGEALQALLAHGSILGLESGDGDLYAWSRRTSIGCAKPPPWPASL